MATIAKFYLHDANAAVGGTLPDSTVPIKTADSAQAGTGDATGARTARNATDTIGALQTFSQFTSNADQTAQHWGHRRFVSPALGAQTLPAGTWVFSYARAEGSGQHNQSIGCYVYAWRPGTGARVGASGVLCTGTEASTTEAAESVNSASNGLNGLAISNGDVLVFDISSNFTQGHSSGYTDTFYYDGTTEASSTDCATFVTPPSALTLASSGTTYTKAGYATESRVA